VSIEPDPIRWTSASRSHPGLVREINEDACLEQPECGLWAVADGMGGHALGEFASRLAPGVVAAFSRDGAGWHTSKRLEVPANVRPPALPPYCPELNPVENLWHYLRSHHWSNRRYDDYDALEAAAMDGWQEVCLAPDTIKSACACPYLQGQSRS
jgi:hypothetical protein